MIPAALAIKIGSAVGGVALLAGAYWYHNESIRDKERAVIAAEEAKVEAENNKLVLQHERSQHANTVDVLQKVTREKDRIRKLWVEEKHKGEKLESYIDAKNGAEPDREVRYVQLGQGQKEEDCVVPIDVTATIDRLSRMHNAVPYSSAVSTDGGDTIDVVIPRSGPATCAQLNQWTEIVTDRLITALVNWRGLSEYVKQEKAINATFHVHQQELTR